MNKKDQQWIRFLDSWSRTPHPWLTPQIEKDVERAMRQAWENGYGNGHVDGVHKGQELSSERVS